MVILRKFLFLVYNRLCLCLSLEQSEAGIISTEMLQVSSKKQKTSSELIFYDVNVCLIGSRYAPCFCIHQADN